MDPSYSPREPRARRQRARKTARNRRAAYVTSLPAMAPAAKLALLLLPLAVLGTPVLLRCSWGTEMLTASGGPAPGCGQWCTSESSVRASQEFLFQEVHWHAKTLHESPNNAHETSVVENLVSKRAQCLFYVGGDDMCGCSYPSFEEFCRRTHFLDRTTLVFYGDSTVGRFARAVAASCAAHAPPTRNASGDAVIIVNEDTLHHLYLPFAREADRSMQSAAAGGRNMLFRSLASVDQYGRLVRDALNAAVTAHGAQANSVKCNPQVNP